MVTDCSVNERPGRRGKPGLPGLFAALVLVVACDGEGYEDAKSRAFVGHPAGSDVALAAVRSGQELHVYVCGGAETFATHTRWFRGEIDDFETFAVEVDGWKLHGELEDERVDGSLVDPDGDALAWTADVVLDGTLAGLYTRKTHGCVAGVVVSQQTLAAEPTAQGSGCDADGRAEQVIILEPLGLTSEGIAVELGGQRLFVERFAP